MKKENYLEKYIEHNSNLTKKSIKDKLFILCVVGIPTGFLGSNKSITIPIIILFILSITIWGIFILRNRLKKQQILYTGVYFMIVSIVFLITSYKIFSLNRKMTSQ